MTQGGTEHKYLSSQVTRNGFCARVGSLKVWKILEGVVCGGDAFLQEEPTEKDLSREGREGKYGYDLSFRQAPSHYMESSGPKGLVRELASKVLILQARGPVQSPEPMVAR